MLDEELERLETRARSASASDKGDGMEPASAKGDKWRDIHSSMAEQSCSLIFLYRAMSMYHTVVLQYCITSYGAWWMQCIVVAKMVCNGRWHSRPNGRLGSSS